MIKARLRSLDLVLVLDQSEVFSPANRTRLSRNYFVWLVCVSNIGILEDEGRRRVLNSQFRLSPKT